MSQIYGIALLQAKWLLLSSLLLPLQTKAFATQDSMKINIYANNQSIEDVFKQIEKQAKISVFYGKQTLDGDTKVSIHLRNASLKDIMNQLLKGKDINWMQKGNSVLLSSKSTVEKTSRDTIPKINLSGQVVDPQGSPIAGATVSVKGQSRGQGTDYSGGFSFANIPLNSTLIISSLGYETKVVKLSDQQEIRISLDTLIREIKAVEVISTGYQTIAKERATGSFELIDNKLFNRRVSTNVLDRLEGIVSGVSFNKNAQTRANESSISIRSRGTIFANPNPLIIVDNFPYQGDINSLNPNDVETVTILKDAAAASIWGAFSGNGVIVITTKKGKNNQPLRVTFNSNITASEKPELHYIPRLDAANYIDYEKFLFSNKYYNSSESSSSRPILSPAIEILIKQRDGKITALQAEAQLASLAQRDILSEQSRYFYRPSVNQQYTVNLSGGGRNQNFYISIGYDRNTENLVANRNDRISINAKNSINLIKDKLNLNFGVYYSNRTISQAGIDNLGVQYPYLTLGTKENPLSVGKTYREIFLDTAGQGKLLDWHYYPLAELGINDNNTKSTDYRFNADLKYNIFNGFDASLSYQYSNGISDNKRLLDNSSFYTRDLINQYSQVNYTTNQVTRAIPFGSIVDRANNNYSSYNLRGQLSYSKTLNNINDISALLGVEQREILANYSNRRMYGYNNETETESQVDLFKEFPLFNNLGTRKIPNPFTNASSNTTNRFRSYFLTASYRLMQKYSLSGSVRRDESNLFGVETNKKGVPLWSIGAAWDISNESFFSHDHDWIQYLKLRTSFGYNGNVDNSLSAYTTAITGTANTFNAPTLLIKNPPNSSLRWEKTKIFNIGLDFRLIKNKIGGSIEYYSKTGLDLISSNPTDPTTGVTVYTGNTANMTGKGVDLTLNSTIINSRIKWSNTILFSYAKEKVTQYNLNFGASSTLFSNLVISPIVGNPLYSVYAYQWAGLDPTNGDPQAYLNGKVSKDYIPLYSSTDIKNVRFIGTAKPVYFGSFINNFEYKKLSLTLNITYKFKYYFRRPALQYNLLLDNSNASVSEYTNRWKQPGDEITTNVPSRVYPINSTRDLIYANSEINILKGDHIRVQDIRLDYPIKFNKSRTNTLINVYCYINNVGLIWKANNSGIDPDFVGSIKTPRSYALGLNVNF